MRWIFISLVILNGCYFGWGIWQSQKEAFEASENDQFKPRHQAAGEDEGFTPSIVLLEEAKSVGTAYKEPTESVVQVAPSAPQVQSMSQIAFSNPSDAVVNKSALCTSVGPFKKIKEAQDLQIKFAENGLSALIKEIVTDSYVENWVLIPPLESRRDALSKLRELQSKGIDSYVMTSGEWSNAISLGLFRRKDSAVGMKDKMNESGYVAELHQIDREVMEYWVKLRASTEEEKISTKIMDLIAPKTTINLQESLCE